MTKINEMMKRIGAIIVAAAALVSAGCGNERIEVSATAANIGFTTSSIESRATPITDPAHLFGEDRGFTVWAYVHAGSWATTTSKTELLAKEPVTCIGVGENWTYVNTAQWPDNSDYVSFFAYAPRSAAIDNAVVVHENTNNATPTIPFTVADFPAHQIDLLIASDLHNQKGYEYTLHNEAVGMKFKHALSQIKFSASYFGEKAGTAEVPVTLTKLALRNVYKSGTVPMTTPIVWSVDADSKTDYQFSTQPEGGLLNITLNDTQQNVLTHSPMFLIPQAVAGRGADQMTIDMTFDIGGGTISYSSPVVMPTEGWLPGKSYDYMITLTDEGINVIVIDDDLTLTPWSYSIVLETVMLTSDEPHDDAQIKSAIEMLNFVAGMGMGVDHLWFGIYGVNDLSHNITIDMTELENEIGFNFQAGRHLVFDFKKTVDNWGTNGIEPYTFEVIYDSAQWELSPAMQTLSVPAGTYYISNATGGYQQIEVDGVTSATLPLTLYNDDQGATVNRTVELTSKIAAKGSIILVRK